MVAKLECGAQFQARSRLPSENTVTDMHRILQMRQQHALFHDKIADLINPDGETIFEPKFAKIIRAMEVELATGTFFTAEGNDVFIAETEELRNVIPHHHSAMRRGQSRDEQAMIATRDCAGDSARSVTAQSVGHEPLAIEQDFARHL